MEKIDIKLKKLDERAVIPSYAHFGDVCMDLTAIDIEYREDMDMYIYKTGLSFETDFGYGQLLFPRSSNRKTDAYLCNSVGVADSAIYRGEILICWKLRDSLETMICSEVVKRKSMNENQKTWCETYEEVSKEFKERARNLEFAPYKVGDKVAQMMVLPYPMVTIIETNELSTSDRQCGGFGSTGN